MVKKLGLMLLTLLLIVNSITASASRALMAMPFTANPISSSLDSTTIDARTSELSSGLPCHNSQLHSSHNKILDDELNTNDNCQHSLCKMLCLWQPLSANSLRIFNNAAASELISTPTSRPHIGFANNLLRPPQQA